MLTPPCPNEAHECQTSDIFSKTLQTRRAVQTGNRSHYKLGFQTVVTVLQVQPGAWQSEVNESALQTATTRVARPDRASADSRGWRVAGESADSDFRRIGGDEPAGVSTS